MCFEVCLCVFYLLDIGSVCLGTAQDGLTLFLKIVVARYEGVDVGCILQGDEVCEISILEALLSVRRVEALCLRLDDGSNEFLEACFVRDVHEDASCTIDSEVSGIGHRHLVLAEGLIPADDALVAIKLEAELTALKLIFCYLRASLVCAYQVEVVAVVVGVSSPLM